MRQVMRSNLRVRQPSSLLTATVVLATVYATETCWLAHPRDCGCELLDAVRVWLYPDFAPQMRRPGALKYTGIMNPGIENIRKKGSRIIAQGTHMLPAASLMMAEGVISSLDDLNKPFVTVINSYTNQIPGHAHLDKIGAIVRDELKALGFNVWYANVGGAVCDGIAMGHYGMKYSLPSRELIADEIETILGAHPCDGWIGIANCDKIVPAMYNAMARVNIPAVYLS